MFEHLRRTAHDFMTNTDVIHQTYANQEISNFGYVKSENNPSNALNKVKRFAPLTKCIVHNERDLQLEQYVI